LRDSSSFNLSSSLMISISRTGLTSPSTWVISSLSKVPLQMQVEGFFYHWLVLHLFVYYLRQRWKIASTLRMWERKAFPNPWPSCAPFTSPAMSTMLRYAWILGLYFNYKVNYDQRYYQKLTPPWNFTWMVCNVEAANQTFHQELLPYVMTTKK
jgi:hypothetical protein